MLLHGDTAEATSEVTYGYKYADIVEVEPAREHGEQAMKILYNGHVLIVRDGHVYTMYGQKIR